jgi:hypothetical protein
MTKLNTLRILLPDGTRLDVPPEQLPPNVYLELFTLIRTLSLQPCVKVTRRAP